MSPVDLRAAPPPLPTFASDLSLPRQLLIKLMRQLGYGRIDGLRIERGEPVLAPMPAVVCQSKVPRGGKAARVLPADPDRTALKKQHLALLRILDGLGDGVVARIHVCNGLPLRTDLAG